MVAIATHCNLKQPDVVLVVLGLVICEAHNAQLYQNAT